MQCILWLIWIRFICTTTIQRRYRFLQLPGCPDVSCSSWRGDLTSQISPALSETLKNITWTGERDEAHWQPSSSSLPPTFLLSFPFFSVGLTKHLATRTLLQGPESVLSIRTQRGNCAKHSDVLFTYWICTTLRVSLGNLKSWIQLIKGLNMQNRGRTRWHIHNKIQCGGVSLKKCIN